MCEICLHSPCLQGCPNKTYRYIGVCEQCNEKLYECDDLWTDEDHNLFCSEDCAQRYHGIKRIEYIEEVESFIEDY